MPPQNEPQAQFENFSKEWQQLSQQDNFDGFRLEAMNSVNKYMQAAHTLFLGTQLRPDGYIYQFGPQFASENGRTVLFSRIGLDRGVNGRFIQKLGTGTEFKINSNSHLKDSQRNMHEVSLESGGQHWAGGLKMVWQGLPLFQGAASLRLHPCFSIGGDCMLIPVNGGTTITQAGIRYAGDQDLLSACVARAPDQKNPGAAKHVHELKMQYVRKVSPRLSLGTECKFNLEEKESGLQMGYEYTMNAARVQGLLDTDGKVSCVVMDYSNFGFSGMIDYARGEYKFGVQMNIFPQPEGAQQPM